MYVKKKLTAKWLLFPISLNSLLNKKFTHQASACAIASGFWPKYCSIVLRLHVPEAYNHMQPILWLKVQTRLCSSRARCALAPNFCSWVTRKSEIFHTNHMLGSLDFTGAEDWAPFNVPWSTALANTKTYRLHSNFICIKFKSQVLN